MLEVIHSALKTRQIRETYAVYTGLSPREEREGRVHPRKWNVLALLAR